MKPRSSNPWRRLCRATAMTVLELLVAMSLLTVIVLALYQVFARVQVAFRSSTSQVDVLEGGRAAMEMMVREVEQARASGTLNVTNFFSRMNPTNALVQTNFTDGGSTHTNWLWDFYFLTFDTYWNGVGYRVASPRDPLALPTNGVGTLYRYSSTSTTNVGNQLLAHYLTNNVPRDMQRIVDGVVRLDVTLFDQAGNPLNYERPYFNTNLMPADTFLWLNHTSVPSYVEIEMGILEPTVLDQVRVFPPGSAQATNFLGDKGGKVHLFRQRIPIRPGF